MSSYEEIREILVSRRKATGLSLREIGEETGIPASTIYSWERTGKMIPRRKASNYLDFIGIEPKDLFTKLFEIRQKSDAK